jgi:NAD(P)H dehydrogenase (quinone)
MKILITGASGNFGSRATRSLLQRMPARDLILISRKPDRLHEFAQAGCEIRYGDFDAPRSRMSQTYRDPQLAVSRRGYTTV